VLEIIHGRRLTASLIGPPLLDDSVVDDRTRHHAPSARMDGWWTVAAGIPTAACWRVRTGISGAITIWLTRWSSLLSQFCAGVFHRAPSRTENFRRGRPWRQGQFSWMN